MCRQIKNKETNNRKKYLFSNRWKLLRPTLTNVFKEDRKGKLGRKGLMYNSNICSQRFSKSWQHKKLSGYVFKVFGTSNFVFHSFNQSLSCFVEVFIIICGKINFSISSWRQFERNFTLFMKLSWKYLNNITYHLKQFF